jgi:hypothetical protein
VKTSKQVKGKSTHQRDREELLDMERRKDFAACAMVEAQSMISHWQRQYDQAKAVFNANLVQYVLKKYSKVSVAQMVKDGFEPHLTQQEKGK